MTDIGTCIIGAGVTGLAVGAEMARRGEEIVVLERAGLIGSETSSRNSEVIHAGIYYPPNSLKARFCVDGKTMLYEHCERYNVPCRNTGKWIVATNEAQLAELETIRKKASANGVHDLHVLTGLQCREIEPEIACLAALNSPSTGIVNSHAFMLSLQGILENHGGQIAFNCNVLALNPRPGGGFDVITKTQGAEFSISAERLILCCGLHTDRLLQSLHPHFTERPPPTRFAKGNYFRLKTKAPFSRLIYPVPEPGGLGVHLTIDLAGQARFGPDVQWIGEIDYTVNPDRAAAFYNEIRKYWPGLPDNALEADYAGIRPKISSPNEVNPDFLVFDQSNGGMKGLTAMLGIESPGLTASLAIARHVAERIVG